MATREKDRLPNLLIRASAGTGKTYQLSQRYLALLQRGVPPERILATTFTRKAAAEILDRIVLKLALAAIDEDQRKKLGQDLRVPRFSQKQCVELLQSVLHNLHRLRISTLDSLFGQIARAFSLELGLPPGWRIADDAEEAEIREAAIDAVLNREDSHTVLDLTHLLTKGEAARGVAQLIRSTVSSLHSLYQETSKEAWYELSRTKQLDPAKLEQLIDELCQLPIANGRMAKARDEDCQRAILGDWENFLGRGLAAKVLNGDLCFYSNPIPDDAVAIYRQLLVQARAILVNRVAAQTEGSHRLLEQFDEQRRLWQQEHRGVRFDDVTHALATALGELQVDQESPRVAMTEPVFAHRLDGGVSHLLLDEFQDTSPKQWRALAPFVSSSTRADQPSSFFCVGDVKQAIYGWRGGVAEIFDAIEKEVSGIESSPLTHSYRSSRAVIELVNLVFAKACQHPRLDRCEDAVKAWCSRYQEHSTERKDWPGFATVRTAPLADDECRAGDLVLETACDLIADLHARSAGGEIGVLVRKNVTVSKLVHLLRKRGLPASEEGGNPLTDSPAVQLVLSLLRLADHPGDSVARYHLAESPLGRAYGLENADDLLAGRTVASELRRQLQTDGFGPVVQRAAALLRDHCHTRDQRRLEQFVERAFAFRNAATLRADDFVRRVECDRVRESDRSPIRVMTVHQSKGLEFETVVLPELDYGLIGQNPAFVVMRPDAVGPIKAVCRYANSNIQKLMESNFQKMFEAATDRRVSEALCVLYVALTRAIHSLHIIIAPSKSNERSFPCTLSGIVRSALYGSSLAPPNTILFSAGDPEWSLVERKEPVTPAVAVGDRRPLRIELPVGTRRRGLERVSPSSLEGGTQVRLQQWLDEGSHTAALRGTLLHACFEQIKWLEDGLPSDADLSARLAEVAQREGLEVDSLQWLREFHACLARPDIDRILRKQVYSDLSKLGFDRAIMSELKTRSLHATVETELPVATIESGRMMSGTIDRLVLLADSGKTVAADIIDFKTDLIPEDKPTILAERVNFYRPQLEAYRKAIVRMTGLQPSHVGARLVFVSRGLVANV